MLNLCLKPVRLDNLPFPVDCGHCRACRLKRRSEWSRRMLDEYVTNNYKAVFIGLNYAPKYLPSDYSVHKDHLQLFFKRLRRDLERKYGDAAPKIRYYACGEYGDKKQRPHYHAIIFGLTMAHADIIYKAWGQCETQSYHCSAIRLNKNGEIDSKAFGYVAGYTCKKLGKFYNRKFAKNYNGRNPEFQLQSLGIGKEYCLSHATEYKTGLTRINGSTVPIPRYYRKLLNVTLVSTPEFANYIKNKEAELYAHILRLFANDYNWSDPNNLYSDMYFYTQCLDKCRQETDRRLAQREDRWRLNHITIGVLNEC